MSSCENFIQWVLVTENRVQDALAIVYVSANILQVNSEKMRFEPVDRNVFVRYERIFARFERVYAFVFHTRER